jgi:exonuclease III
VSDALIVLTGGYNVIPTDLDIYAPGRWVDDVRFRPEVRHADRRLVEQGWTRAKCWAHSVDWPLGRGDTLKMVMVA